MKNPRRPPSEPRAAPLRRDCWGLHIPDRERQLLPDDPPVPRRVRVVARGVVIDDWLIPFPLTDGQMRWIIDMCYRWAILDNSDSNFQWLGEILGAIDGAFRRYASDRV